jgi:hypothetical protein
MPIMTSLSKHNKQHKQPKQASNKKMNPPLRLGNSSLAGNWMPQRFRAQLRFSTAVEIPADTSFQKVAISGNGPQDPTGSVSSRKPPGFALLASIYSQYRCLGSHCEVRILCDTDTKDTPATAYDYFAAMAPMISSSFVTDYNSLSAQPGAKRAIGNVFKPSVLKNTVASAKMFGLIAPEASPGFWALVSTVPAYEWFWVIGIGTATSMQTSNVIRAIITVTYDVEWFQKINPGETSLISAHWEAAYLQACKEVSEQKTVRESLDDFVDVKGDGATIPRETKEKQDAAKILVDLSQKSSSVGQAASSVPPTTPVTRPKPARLGITALP